jgi:hypothetical protein
MLPHIIGETLNIKGSLLTKIWKIGYPSDTKGLENPDPPPVF